MDKEIKLYKYVDGVNDTPFPSEQEQAIAYSFKMSAPRMGGASSVTATIKHRLCLDDLWSDNVYIQLNGEKFFVLNTPSSSKDNTDERYVHEITFLSEVEILNHVFFIDAVQGDSGVDVYKSNSTKVIFTGDINEFVARLNASMKYSGLDFSVVVDEGVTSEDKMVSFEDKYLMSALQEIFNVYQMPYYQVGKVFHVGYSTNTITMPLKYGANEALLSIAKNNANYQVINRITGIGSSDNIPYYYPNESDNRAEIEASGKKWITPMPNLMPSIYRESEGAEMFYNATNDTYPNGEGGYYIFENVYSQKTASEGKVTFEDIKPSIVGMTNASGQRMDMFIDFAYDLNDNDEVDEEGNYIHPYFFAKLPKYNGEFGFNLFDQAIESQTMQVSFTSGVCGACSFEIGVGEETQKNIVQVDDIGNLKRDENGNVLWENQLPQDRQNDTQNYEVWIALKKDNTTYGQIMPNVSQSLKPSTSDKFVLLGIDMPLAYVKAAEKKLDESLIKHMWMNNREKFTFEIKFSRIFFTEHPEILEQLNQNSRVLVEYNGQQHTLYVDDYEYSMDENNPLPEININLVDTLTIGQNSLQNTIDSVKQDILSAIGGGDFLKQGLKYFLRKDVSDTANGKITFNKGLLSKDDVIIGKDGFAGGLAGFGAKIDKNGRAEMRALRLWEFLEVPELRFNSVKVFLGIDWQVPGAGIIETCTPDTDAEGNVLDTGTCTLKLEQGQYGAIDVDDIALGIWHFGNETDATEDSDDSKGNFTFAGFATTYFRITEVSGANNGTFRYWLRSNFKVHPQPQMNFACYGNFNKEERQTSTYRTRTYTRRLWKQNTWEIGAQNIAMQDGDLSNLNIFGLNMTGYSMYVNSVYFTGVVSQVKPDGTPVLTANDRGAWQNDTKYEYYDRVSHNGCIWLCVNEDGTNTEPTDDNPNWLKQVDKGENGQDGTSFKILGSKNDPSELPQEGNEIGDAYLISGDLWVWTADNVWKNVGNIQGPAGESVKPLGNWYSGMTVPYLGVVRMGTATFMCTNKNGTTNPPLWIWTDKDTNRFIYSDGGYVLTGEVNNTDYLIIAEDGTNAVSIIKVDVEYAIATSNTTAPTSGWQTLAPQWENGKYIWSRSVTYYSDGNKTMTEAACISGGKGIKRIVEYYYRSTSATELIGGEWTTTCPEWINGTYIWTKSVIEYTDGTIDEEGEVNSTGAQGESPIIADLDNEMESIPLDFEGYTTQEYTIQTTLSVWYGSKKADISEINISAPDNITTSYVLNTGVITVKVAKGVKLQDLSRVDISVVSYIQNQKYTRNAVLSIAAIKAGEHGEDAVLYKLLPSVSSIIKKKDGNYNVDSVSCRRIKSQGSNSSVTTDGELKYKIDDSSETSISNDSPIQVESIRYSITFLFYINNILVDKETIPMIEDGIDGEGFTNLGKWHTDLLVPKMGVVTMAGSSWVATTATRNPPLWCWTDKDGNRFIFNDNGYVLTGEQNTAEYDLLAEKGDAGTDGEDGKDGMDGLPGKDGTDYEYIYKRTTTESRPSTPATSQQNDYVPSGWTDNPQGVSMTYMYEWMCKRTKQNGTWSAFSTPALWAKYGKNGEDGLDGAQGDQGALPRYRGVYKSSERYIYGMENGILIRDIVVHESTIYQVATRGDVIENVTPPNSRWEESSKYEFVAMNTALIDNANIGGFIFRRLGWLADGSPYGELRSQNNGTDGNPMLQMFTKTGKFICQEVDVKGKVTATSGTFENVTIKGRLLTPFTYLSGTGYPPIQPGGPIRWKYYIGSQTIWSSNNNINYIITGDGQYHEVILPTDTEFAGMYINLYNDGTGDVYVKQKDSNDTVTIQPGACIRFTCIATETKFIKWVHDFGSYWS